MSEICSADPHLGRDRREPPGKYLCLRFRVEVAAEDEFVAEMGSLSTLGIEKQDQPADESSFLVYFHQPVAPAVREIATAKRRVAGGELLEAWEFADQDWMALYREHLQPFALGRKWWVDPREPESPEVRTPARRRLLRIPAWTAFGTGSHISTALLVRLLEGLPLSSKRILDLGTGTGILAMVALASGAASVTALDIDPVAACVAQQTCRLNHLRPHIVAGSVGVLLGDANIGTYDLAMANVIPSLLRPDLPGLVESVVPQGRILLSGILIEQEDELLAELGELGLGLDSRLADEGWVALQMERVST